MSRVLCSLLAGAVVLIAWAALGLLWLARAAGIFIVGGIMHYRLAGGIRCTDACRTRLDHPRTAVVR